MAVIQLADIYDPLRFATLAQEAQLEKNAFVQSGVQYAEPTLMQYCGMSGFSGEFDEIKPLGINEPDYSSDNPADRKDPDNLGTQQLKYRKAARTKSWSGMDIARGIALNDPMKGITDRIGHYWATDNEKRLINSLVGILNDNVANHAGDMVVNVATDAAGAPSDAEKASAMNFLKALELKGDMDNIAAIAMHSTVYYGLRALRQVVQNWDPITNSSFDTFEGKRVIVDDACPAVAGANRVNYTSFLFGYGSVAAGEGNMPETLASEYHRDPGAGNGSGQNTLYSRRTDIIMPIGFSFESASVAGLSATYAELQDAANWSRVWDPKNIPLSFLVTNG